MRNQRFVTLFWGEGEDVVVEEVFEVDSGGETLVAWRREVVKGIANLRGGGGELLLLLGTGIDQRRRKLLLVELVLVVVVVVLLLLVVVVVLLLLVLVVLVVLLMLVVVLLLLLVLLVLVKPKRIGLEVERSRHGKPPRASAGRWRLVVPVRDCVV